LPKIGVFDSGYGGLTVLRSLLDRLPQFDFVYGRPGSVTLIAGAGEDVKIAALAGALHQQSGATLGATGWSLPRRRR